MRSTSTPRLTQPAACLLLGLFLSIPVLANDSITLSSGEVIEGRIISETDTSVVIEVANASRTIFTKETIPKAEITSIQRESAEAKREKKAYEALQRYQLNADQEFSAAQCDEGVTACEKFLATYSEGQHAAGVRQLRAGLLAEKEQVERGLVKFGNRWMNSTEKASEVEVRTAFSRVQQLQQELATLERQRDRTVEGIGAAKQSAAYADAAGRDADKKVAERDRRYWYWDGTTWRSKQHITEQDRSARTQAAQSRGFYEGQIRQGEAQLDLFREKINRTKVELSKAERDYAAAKLRRDRVASNP